MVRLIMANMKVLPVSWGYNKSHHPRKMDDHDLVWKPWFCYEIQRIADIDWEIWQIQSINGERVLNSGNLMKGLPSLNEQFDLQFYAESMPIGGFFSAYIEKDQHPLCHLDPYCGANRSNVPSNPSYFWCEQKVTRVLTHTLVMI